MEKKKELFVKQEDLSLSSALICRKTNGITWDIKVYDVNPDDAQEKAMALYKKTKQDLIDAGENVL